MKYGNPNGEMTKSVVPEICECGRMYKDRRENGKTMCAMCYSGYSLEELRVLWGRT
jgi:hypothetical protein